MPANIVIVCDAKRGNTSKGIALLCSMCIMRAVFNTYNMYKCDIPMLLMRAGKWTHRSCHAFRSHTEATPGICMPRTPVHLLLQAVCAQHSNHKRDGPAPG